MTSFLFLVTPAVYKNLLLFAYSPQTLRRTRRTTTLYKRPIKGDTDADSRLIIDHGDGRQDRGRRPRAISMCELRRSLFDDLHLCDMRPEETVHTLSEIFARCLLRGGGARPVSSMLSEDGMRSPSTKRVARNNIRARHGRISRKRHFRISFPPFGTRHRPTG